MIFLIVYDRPTGTIMTLREFADADLPIAEEARLQIELELGRAMATREVVIFSAASLAALRATHRRYFETLEQLAARVSDGAQPKYPAQEP